MMTESSKGVTKRLLARLLRDQRRRAARERKMPFAEKLAVLDRLMQEHGGQTQRASLSTRTR